MGHMNQGAYPLEPPGLGYSATPGRGPPNKAEGVFIGIPFPIRQSPGRKVWCLTSESPESMLWKDCSTKYN